MSRICPSLNGGTLNLASSTTARLSHTRRAHRLCEHTNARGGLLRWGHGAGECIAASLKRL
eukprot:4024544-Pyramimonas_sp.AAC.1